MKRRYKLLLIIFISFILVIIIYLLFYKPKYTYFFIGEDFSNSITYDFNDYLNYYFKDKNIIYKEILDPPLIDEYIDLIDTNKGNINYYLKNANLIVISLGIKELENYKELDQTIIIEYLNNVYKFLSYIRSINQGDIFLINLYSDDYEFINKKLKKYTSEFSIYYIDSKISLRRNEFYIDGKLNLSHKGHKNIADYIVGRIEL